MRIIGEALASITRSMGVARRRRARPWLAALVLAAMSLGMAQPPAPRVCKLRGAVVLPERGAAAAPAASVDAAHEHDDRAGLPGRDFVPSCSSAFAALPAPAGQGSFPAQPWDVAADGVTGFVPSHDPPPPFHPPRLS